MSNLNTIPVDNLLLDISTYFQSNPGIIAEQYDEQEAKERELLKLEAHCATLGVWFEEDYWEDGFAPNTYTVHLFHLRDFSKLEDHDYGDDDGVKIYIHEDGNQILDLMVECH